MTTPSFVPDLARRLDEQLAAADHDLAEHYPGDRTDRGPIHTVYVPGDVFTAETTREWGDRALQLLEDFAPDTTTLADAVGAPIAEVEQVYGRLQKVLQDGPIQDLRIDFEDGYGRRPDETEDAHVAAATEAIRQLLTRPERPTWWGIRFKAFEAPTRERGLRTLASFVDSVRNNIGDGLTLTLPKVTSVAQVDAMVHACDTIEQALGLPHGSLGFEIQVETAQAIMAGSGLAPLAPMIRAGRGRVTSLHYGTFDYSAGLGIAAPFQALDHPVADHAKNVMQVSAAQTGVRMSDGSTNVVAFGDRDQAHATWRLHAGLVERSLVRGIYQGWDMHPGHLPTRFLANMLFFRRAMPTACARLSAYLNRTAGDVMDEPATARMLATALLRGAHCGAIDPAEIEASAGITVDHLVDLTR
ncbi:DUF6986 family protein [Calidifontibacter terrae]